MLEATSIIRVDSSVNYSIVAEILKAADLTTRNKKYLYTFFAKQNIYTR